MASSIGNFTRFYTLFGQNTSALYNLPRLTLSRLVDTTSISAFSYQVQPERLEEISRSPSGWVPPQKPSPTLSFQIKRSKTNNLPVYVDKKRGGSLVLTVIRNIKGDLNELETFLKQNLGDGVHFQTNEVTSQVKIKGYHKDTVVRLLKELGF